MFNSTNNNIIKTIAVIILSAFCLSQPAHAAPFAQNLRQGQDSDGAATGTIIREELAAARAGGRKDKRQEILAAPIAGERRISPPGLDISLADSSADKLDALADELIRTADILLRLHENANLTSALSLACEINPNFHVSFSDRQLKSADLSTFTKFMAEANYKVFMPANQFFTIKLESGAAPLVLRANIDNMTWRQQEYILGTSVWVADMAWFDAVLQDLIGISVGQFALTDLSKAERDAYYVYDLIVYPHQRDYLASVLREWFTKAGIDRAAYVEYFGKERNRQEEIRHVQDHLFASLLFGQPLSDLEAEEGKVVEAILKPGSSLNKWYRRDSNGQSMIFIFSVREYAGQLGGIINEMESCISEGKFDLAYCLFLEWVATKRPLVEMEQPPQDAMDTIYRLAANWFFSGMHDENNIDSMERLISLVENGDEHPGIQALKLLKNIYKTDFYSDDERIERINQRQEMLQVMRSAPQLPAVDRVVEVSRQAQQVVTAFKERNLLPYSLIRELGDELERIADEWLALSSDRAQLEKYVSEFIDRHSARHVFIQNAVGGLVEVIEASAPGAEGTARAGGEAKTTGDAGFREIDSVSTSKAKEVIEKFEEHNIQRVEIYLEGVEGILEELDRQEWEQYLLDALKRHENPKKPFRVSIREPNEPGRPVFAEIIVPSEPLFVRWVWETDDISPADFLPLRLLMTYLRYPSERGLFSGPLTDKIQGFFDKHTEPEPSNQEGLVRYSHEVFDFLKGLGGDELMEISNKVILSPTFYVYERGPNENRKLYFGSHPVDVASASGEQTAALANGTADVVERNRQIVEDARAVLGYRHPHRYDLLVREHERDDEASRRTVVIVDSMGADSETYRILKDMPFREVIPVTTLEEAAKIPADMTIININVSDDEIRNALGAARFDEIKRFRMQDFGNLSAYEIRARITAWVDA